MITISLDTIDRAEANKPAGYKAACLAAGTVQDGILYLDEAAFAVIRQRFTMPSLTKQAISFGGAVASECRSIAAGDNPVTDNEKTQRLTICAECEFFIAGENRCANCGCKLTAKAAMRSQSCPQGKWPQLTGTHGREAPRRS